jgi:hypothetical protein
MDERPPGRPEKRDAPEAAELQELRQHVRWLEDERRDAVAVEDHLKEMDDRLNGIDDGLAKLVDSYTFPSCS